MPGWKIVLVAWILIIIVLCTFPWWVESPRWARVRWIPLVDMFRSYRLLRDALANCFLYVPLGFAYARMQGTYHLKFVGEAAIVGFLLSVACEFYQIFSPVRFPSMTDVVMNTIGAFAGALIAGKSLASPGRT
ncbi:MAG TPA: VanZ family protein [Nitrospira sp.]|jgi:glycopeptide antibiotics resistance protein|nr:VanZ family protein [Nitrospira sp.]